MKTKLIILGVNHSYQLVSKECQPAVYRAFLDRVKPTVIGIERSPNEFAAADFYDFTYEQQKIVIPYAKEKGIQVFPFDWLATSNDQRLAWDIGDIDQPSFIRGKGSLKDFTYFWKLEEDFFYSEREDIKEKISDWISKQSIGEADFPRRLFLYRTYMQAMRIKAMAKELKTQTMVVVVGHMHKNDLENILSNIPFIEIVQPSEYGYPTELEISNHILEEDLFAICSFNLLGLQSNYTYNSEWIATIIERLSRLQSFTEVQLYRTRLAILNGEMTPKDAINVYKSLLLSVRVDENFKYTGVRDESRVDSYYDPFGNMTVKNRLLIELAREHYKISNLSETKLIKSTLIESMKPSILKMKQLEVYWDKYLINK